MLSKGKKIVIIILLILFVVVVAANIYIGSIVQDKHGDTMDTNIITNEENAIKVTKGNELGNKDVPEESITPAADEKIYVSKETEPKKEEVKEEVVEVTPTNVNDIINKKKEYLIADTLDTEWYYGTLNVIEDYYDDAVVVFDYNKPEEMLKQMYLYNPKNDQLIVPSYFNDNKDGIVRWDVSSLEKGTYAVFIELQNKGQTVGEYTCYDISKTDWDNMNEFTGVLVDDEE